MVSTDRLLAFAALSLALIVIPGPSVLFVVDRTQGHVAGQMLLLGLVFNVIALVSDSVWGLAAAGARDWFARSPQRMSVIGGVGGLTMIGLGVAVAATGRKD